MTDMYTCKSCGSVTTEKGHLCNPMPVDDACDLCSEPVENARHICKPMLEKMEYKCGGCGRPTEDPDLVCKPVKLSEGK
jgi:DNA-directed RNA polymerase subunit RPC12/RpoP